MEQILQQILSKLDNLETGQQELRYDVRALKAGQQRLEAEITNIKKDTARIPYVEQAVSEVSKEVQGLQQASKEH